MAAQVHDKTLPIDKNYSRNECCWRCGQKGHYSVDCENPGKPFCSRYYRQNILSRDFSCQKDTSRLVNDKKKSVPIIIQQTETLPQQHTLNTEIESRCGTPDSAEEDYGFYITIKILEKDFSALIDSGAAKSFMGKEIKDIFDSNQIPSKNCNFEIVVANGAEVPINVYYNVNCQWKECSFSQNFYYMPDLRQHVILGIDFLFKCGVKLQLMGEEIYPRVENYSPSPEREEQSPRATALDMPSLDEIPLEPQRNSPIRKRSYDQDNTISPKSSETITEKDKDLAAKAFSIAKARLRVMPLVGRRFYLCTPFGCVRARRLSIGVWSFRCRGQTHTVSDY